MEQNLHLQTSLEFIDSEHGLLDDGIAFASMSLNPNYQWVKVIVTDDKPNANHQRVPKEEFANIIKTGVYSPLKMDFGRISPGHKEALGKPIGTFTNFNEYGDKLIALAALWKNERPDDVALLKEMYDSGASPNISWELSYDAEAQEEDGTTALNGIKFNGAVVVGNPAYKGRTSFIAMSSEQTNSEDSMEELELARQKISELETKVSELGTAIAEKDTELAELTKFKNDIEATQAKASKLQAIREKFVEAGIVKDDEFFATREETFLAMNEDALNFVVQELAAFSKPATQTSASVAIPNITGTPKKNYSARELGELLRTSKQK
jgi:hypothetical protein